MKNGVFQLMLANMVRMFFMGFTYCQEPYNISEEIWLLQNCHNKFLTGFSPCPSPPPAIFSGYKTVHSKPLTFSRIQQQFEVCSNSYSFVKNLNEWSYPWTILTRKKKKCRSKSPGWSKQKRSASLESQYWRQRWIAAGQSLIQTMRGGEMQYLSPTYLHPKTVFCEMILKISKHKKCNTEMHNHGGVQMK